MKRRIRRIRRALKRAGLYNAFHITLIAVLLTGFCVILFNIKEPEQQEKEPEEVQAEVTQNPETMTQTAESIEESTTVEIILYYLTVLQRRLHGHASTTVEIILYYLTIA